ncbi:DUF4325 domain-containing protein [Pseudomonas sediminis]|uniref:STAS-like domain-containing protein n=1 Tax=Pseudomonas TaxID=286 RepID=UPI000CB25A5B|nr:MULTISPECIES: DUF4325 domain-containing protein [Pseudomonas]MDG9758105.1 DUF4325 domain-containing protein [Pseudomonas sediminis]PKQ39192.1 DUF4325 domain-containing protein [Pseudomonas sp. YY-1]
MATLNIGKEFSTYPEGRYYSDEGDSGEEFREEHLLPKLKNLLNNEKLLIILDDGVEGYGSSFLTEGFAGVVKYGHMKSDELLSKIEISYSDPDFEFFKDRAIQYIKEAVFNSKIYTPTQKQKNK